jgi:hypothetical protein
MFGVTLDPNAPFPVVSISEFLTENKSGLEDVDHDTPDWIEITNAGPGAANLAGWGLSDKANKPMKWTFPSPTTLAAGQRLVVFASGKDRSVAGQELHTNFKLSSSGYLSLRRPTGEIVQVFDGYPQQEGNVSFGPLPGSALADGANAWRYFPTPTPGAANGSSNLSGSAIHSVTAMPIWPTDADDIIVSAQLAAVPGPITAATLFYRVQHGAEVSLPMTLNGAVYTATIPASASAAGQMVRWRVAVTAGGVGSRWPINDNVAVELPLYLGTTIQNTALTTALPVYEVFVNGYANPPTPRARTTRRMAMPGRAERLRGRGCFTTMYFFAARARQAATSSSVRIG